jgi:Fe-S cluster assembly iron-binding protein IscA
MFPGEWLNAAANYLVTLTTAAARRPTDATEEQRRRGCDMDRVMSESLVIGAEKERAADERLEAEERRVVIAPSELAITANATIGYVGRKIFEILEVPAHDAPSNKPLAGDVLDLLISTALFAKAIAQLDNASSNHCAERICYEALATVKMNLRQITWSRALE